MGFLLNEIASHSSIARKEGITFIDIMDVEMFS